jgi:hypothetical protein
MFIPADLASPSEVATSTLSPTPMPIPFALSVQVTGEGNAPITGAYVTLEGVAGENGTQLTDDLGMVSWSSVPRETVKLSISAQGYLPSETSATVDQGDRQESVSLERDPFGLLPAEACAPGESILHVEDFQDGEARRWPEIQFRAQGWEIGSHPDSQGDLVLYSNNTGSVGSSTQLRYFYADDFVLRIHFMVFRNAGLFVGVHEGTPYEPQNDIIMRQNYAIHVDRNGVVSFRGARDLVGLGGNDKRISPGDWHLLEIGVFEGLLEIWVDKYCYLSYQDPAPVPGGTLGLGAYRESDDDFIYINDISVCGLTEPYVPLHAAKTD